MTLDLDVEEDLQLDMACGIFGLPSLTDYEKREVHKMRPWRKYLGFVHSMQNQVPRVDDDGDDWEGDDW